MARSGAAATKSSDADVSKLVAETLETLGLTNCADTYCGDEDQKGISGGQRKRVSIGMHKKPSVAAEVSTRDSQTDESAIENPSHDPSSQKKQHNFMHSTDGHAERIGHNRVRSNNRHSCVSSISN